MLPAVRVVTETGSTNEDMKALALDGVAEGTWLRAERQTAGRGRMGRIWEGVAGNLFASTLVRLAPNDPPAASLAFVAAVSVYDVVSDFVGRDVLTLKWPNDIMAGRAKLCGILLERAGDAVIIGIGVNIADAPEMAERLTVSMRSLGVGNCDAGLLLEEIAMEFAVQLDRWRTYGVESIVRAWLARAHAPGTPLFVNLPDGTSLEGRFETLGTDGALILSLADGTRHVIHAGDIFLL